MTCVEDDIYAVITARESFYIYIRQWCLAIVCINLALIAIVSIDKACAKLGAIRKTRNCAGHSTALTLYKSLVLPHLDYCDVVYMTANKDLLTKLQMVRNVACRTLLVANKREHNISEIHKELELYTLSERREFHLSTLCHKNIYI